jgi:hypothetical protein
MSYLENFNRKFSKYDMFFPISAYYNDIVNKNNEPNRSVDTSPIIKKLKEALK